MISATVKLPKAFRPGEFERAFAVEMLTFINEVGKDFQRTVQTWDDKPAWTHDIKRTPLRLVGRWVTIADNGKPASPNTVYKFISRGTDVGYATMSDPFSAKTAVRRLDSGAGVGEMLYVSRRRPHRGIDAREFEELIAERKAPRFKALMEKAMRDGAKQSGHKF